MSPEQNVAAAPDAETSQMKSNPAADAAAVKASVCSHYLMDRSCERIEITSPCRNIKRQACAIRTKIPKIQFVLTSVENYSKEQLARNVFSN